MSQEKETNKDVLDKLTELEQKIDSQKKESVTSSEDQLFFGVIISLLVLFVTLPVNDMASFLKSVFHVGQDIALTNAGYIKYIGIVIFLISSMTRYCAVVSYADISKKFRFISFEALWLGLNVIILNIAINLFTLLSLQIGALGLTGTCLILTLIFAGMLTLEGYVLKVYTKRDFISKKQLPYASILFLSIMFGISVALIVEIVVQTLGEPFSTVRFYAVYIPVAMAYFLIYVRRARKKSNVTKTSFATLYEQIYQKPKT